MTPAATELEAAGRLAIAALVGSGVGLEREWSGQATGQNARFAGLRTFLLLGLAGGIAGLLMGSADSLAGVAIIAGSMALTVAAYVMAARRPTSDVGATTEAAALVVIALGVISGMGWMALAAGAGSIVVLALREKAKLHWLVQRIDDGELRATLQFAVLALVVLPILPEGPFGGALDLRPRAIWMLVLLFSGLNFAAYLIQRALGGSRGYIVTGLAGGLLSSTLVSLDFSRRSRRETKLASALGYGVIGACTVLIPRVITVSAILNRDVALKLASVLWLPALFGVVVTVLGWRASARSESAPVHVDAANPLRLWAAVRMAVAFQIAITVIAAVRERWGTTGVYASASVLGLTDMDALTMSMSRLDGALTTDVAARAIVIGMIVNTAFKLTVSLVLGAPEFRRVAGLGLVGIGAVTGAVFFLM